MRHPHACVFVASIVLALSASGCGPMFLPMLTRLAPDDQKKFDEMWSNMLTPVNRVDHQTLLDTVIVYFMFQLGVDRLHMVTEKNLANGKVVMDIDCDRVSPESDQFTITVLDDHGHTLRRERYSRKDVEESAQALTNIPRTLSLMQQAANTSPATEPTTAPASRPSSTTQTTLPATQEAETSEQRKRRLDYQHRIEAVQAATQPAVLKPGN
jgi:hypothetical protein